MTLAAITDHVEHGLSRLLEQFKGKPRLEAWISSYLEGVQELTDAAWAVLVMRLIDDAVGEQLTVLGRLVGQPRIVEDEERYRVLVRARIAVNSSSGKPDDLIRVANLLFGADAEYSMHEFFPAALVFSINEAIDVIPALEQGMLDEAAAGGVRVDVHFSADEPDELFAWGAGDGWGSPWRGAVSEH